MTTIQESNLIAVDPAIRNGRPHILTTTVTMADVAIAKIYHSLDADGIAAWYGLTLPQVYAALSYYYSNKVEIDGQIQSQIRQAEEIKAIRYGATDSLLSR